MSSPLDLLECVAEALPTARIPSATYRLQFNSGFTFKNARRWVSYLSDLGISDVYASPYLKASSTSTHGYDVADHNSLNPAIGTESEYNAFVAELQRHGMGQILDIVPNHMGIAETANTWWMDVLENGPSSPYAHFFDINWQPLKPELRGKVLLAILGDKYGIVLENGELNLSYEGGAFFLNYYETVLPIAPGTYNHILQLCLGALASELEMTDVRLLELQSIITSAGHLPGQAETSPESVAEQQREKEVLKRRLAALVSGSPEVSTALEATLRVFNGVQGVPSSYDLLNSLLEDQAYRLAFWRVAAEEINYRRFFDINSLAAIRVEHPDVFAETHRLILRLVAEGKVSGLRIDHPDGLWDPAGYLRELLRSVLTQRDGAYESSNGAGEHISETLATLESAITNASAVGGLLVDKSNRRAFDELYTRFVGRKLDYRDLVNSAKKRIMLLSLAGEINALAHRLNQISERHRRFRDFTSNSLTFAVREVVAALPVYRTYLTCDSSVTASEREAIESAVREAKRRNPGTEASIFDFIRDLLLLRYPAGDTAEDRRAQCDFVMKFQQTTGPVTAKGVEDTAFYVYNRLASLNEVGGEPEHFGITVPDFHRLNAHRQEHWPHSMLSTSTHDTKRSEDVRARINVLSEIPGEWSAAPRRWGRWNAQHKRRLSDGPAPDRNDEYLIYQTLLGAGPFDLPHGEPRDVFVQRIKAYMQKATKEAKVHAGWINPNQEYDEAVTGFIEAILDEDRSLPFLGGFSPLQLKVAHFGIFNSISQALLKLTCPGVPDIHQGNELWDFSLVDPDNRRAVDYPLRARLLKSLRQEISRANGKLVKLLAELLANREDGRLKLYVTHRLLELRSRLPQLFSQGKYESLSICGPRAANVCAFARTLGNERALVVAPRLFTQLVSYPDLPIGPVWSECSLELPNREQGGSYRDVFSGLTLEWSKDGPGVSLALEEVLRHFPVAVLEQTSG